jgi:hypothetical protein
VSPAASPAALDRSKHALTANEPTERCLVVLLNQHTWAGQRGARLARQVLRIKSAGARVLLLHDVSSCAFRDVMETTPKELIQGGLYKALATDLLPGRAEKVSAAHFASALGCTRTFEPKQGEKRPWFKRIFWGQKEEDDGKEKALKDNAVAFVGELHRAHPPVI